MSLNVYKYISKDKIDTVLTVCKWLWISAVILFACLFILRKWDILGEFISKLSLFNILVSFLAMGIAKIFLTLNMHITLRYENVSFPFPETFRIYNESQIAKYIPGGIWHYIGKAVMLKNRNLSLGLIRNVMFLELVWIVISSLLFGSVFLFFSERNIILTNLLQTRIKPGLYFLIPLMSIVILLLLYKNNLFTRLGFWLRQYRNHMLLLVNGFIVWAAIGYSFYIIFVPYNTGTATYTYISALYAVAYLIGFIFPLAPAGLGLRESVLVLGLTGIVDLDTAIMIGSLNRLIYIITEVLLLFVCIPLKRINPD